MEIQFILTAIFWIIILSIGFKILRAILHILLGILGFLRHLLSPFFRPDPFVKRVKAIDGDSLAFDHEGEKYEIRIFGIDAPEYSQPEGPHAAKIMRSMVNGQEITIQPLRWDKYGRIVAEVFLPDGTDIGRTMVQKGLAIAETRFSKKYLADEKYAKYNRIGFWQNGGFVTPAEWRATNPSTS